MSKALLKAGPILFSMCDWGVQDPWLWASSVGNSWRTDEDISDGFDSVIRVLDNQIGLSIYAGPGAWNDPDMLEVGNGGLAYVEERSHFALWCLLKAPLLIGCDIRSMNNRSAGIFMAEELIAVSQDPLGVQGDLIYQTGPIQIWAGPLSDGSRAVVMFNRHTIYTFYQNNITVQFSSLGYPAGTQAVVRDLYGQQNIGTFTDSFSWSVAVHDCFAAKITPTTFEPAFFSWVPR